MKTTEEMTSKIEEWKKKYGDIFCYEADGKSCYLRRPSRNTISAASVVGKDDPFKFAEIIIANCWLGGEEELRVEDKYFMGLSQKVSDLVEIKVGALKKL